MKCSFRTSNITEVLHYVDVSFLVLLIENGKANTFVLYYIKLACAISRTILKKRNLNLHKKES